MTPPGIDFKIHHLKALYEWILGQEETPFISFVSDYPGVSAPAGPGSKDGRLMIDLSPGMVSGVVFNLESSMITLMASFGGVFQRICIPSQAVLSLTAKESCRGETFEVRFPPAVDANQKRRPKLTVVASG